MPSPPAAVLAIAVICLFAHAIAAAQGVEWTITPGAGHDRFTETFYLDDTTSIQSDSLKQIKLTEDALRESYGSLGIGAQQGRWSLETTAYATDAAWRDISVLRGRFGTRQFYLDVNSRLEWKGVDSDDSLASAYTYWRSELRPRYRLNDRWQTDLRAEWETADYNRRNSYTVDYHRYRLQAGLAYLGAMLQSVDLAVGVANRGVPDSARLAYEEVYLRTNAYGLYLGDWRFSASGSMASRSYQNDPDGNDHRRYFVDLRTDLDWSALWRAYASVEWQRWDYITEDETTYDVDDWLARASARAIFADQWELGGLMEFRYERPSSAATLANEYVQWGAGPVIEWRPGTAFWIEITHEIGYRDYDATSLVYDDYSFWESGLQADLFLSSGPNANVSISYLRESHDDTSRDIDQLYLSLGVRFPIKP